MVLFREVIPRGGSELQTLALDPRVRERTAELPESLAPRDVVTSVLETLIEIDLIALDKEQAAQQQELAEVAP